MSADLRFFAETSLLNISRDRWSGLRETEDAERKQDVPQLLLYGLASFDVEDRYGPPSEWTTIGLKRIHKVQRIPLRASVRAVREVDWAKEFGHVEPDIAGFLLREAGSNVEKDDERAVSLAEALSEVGAAGMAV